MIADLVTDANAARPITAGGTGATTAIGAADNLFTKSSDIASAATTDLSTATGMYAVITGTTTITAFGTEAAGVTRVLRFSGILTLTHNATSLILPGAANIATVAGDTAVFVSEGSGNWRCASYQRASGAPLIFANASALTGSVVASSTTSYATYGSITTTIPTDDTKPQITEGNPIFSVNFTPQTTTNKLRIRATVPCTGSGLINVIGALFVASGTDAVQVDYNTIPAADYFHTLNLEYEFTPGVTSAVNVQVRCGPASGTMYINGTTTTRRFGGALAATLVIEEIKA